jgi:hypothetical protein
MKSLILSWLIGLQWTPADRATETPEARLERLTTIAESVADLTRGDARKAAFVLVQFKRETDYDSAVQRCECTRYQCDPIKTTEGIYFRAHSLSQAHEVGFRDLASWWELCDTTRAAVDANVKFTLRFYTPQNLSCGYHWLGGGQLKCLFYPDTHPRAAEARRLAGRI